MSEKFDQKIFSVPQRSEYQYTKSDLFHYFNSIKDRDITHTPQYWAGSFFLKKNIFSNKFLDQWIDVFIKNFNLVDDSPSKIDNFDGFIENRHDQSVFSLLCKLKKLGLLEELKLKYFFVDYLKHIRVNFQKVLSAQDQTKKFNICAWCILDFLLRSI